MYVKRGRGRLSRKSILYADFIESIILIAGKYDLDPELLIDALVEAWSYETSHLRNLKITCREVNQDSATFLVTEGEKAVFQFPITLEILNKPEYLKDQVQYFPPPHRAQRKLEGNQRKIDQLSYGMRGVDVKVKIIEIPPALHVQTRFGNTAHVSNVKVADETGSIRLTLWNDQINKIHVGDTVEIKNCYIAKYRKERRLRIGRKGTLTIIDDEEVS